MKTKTNIILIAATCAFLAFGNCKDKKKEVVPEPENTVSNLLKAHSWKYNPTFYLKKSGVLYEYVFPTCLLDDTLDFINNTYYLKDPATILCSGQTEKTDTLGWRLLNNNTQLEINNKGTIVINDILTINADSLLTKVISPIGDTFVYVYLRY